MRTALLLLSITLLFLPNATASSNVTLQLNLGSQAAPAYATCGVTINAPADGAAVLDAAVASGCIKSWSYESFPGLGRYVTCIDDGHANLCQDPTGGTAAAWLYYIDGQQAQGGVDDGSLAPVNSGDTVQFVYTNWVPTCVGLNDPCGLGYGGLLP